MKKLHHLIAPLVVLLGLLTGHAVQAQVIDPYRSAPEPSLAPTPPSAAK
jgi:hypothetical protein